jgi:hypothetical protein
VGVKTRVLKSFVTQRFFASTTTAVFDKEMILRTQSHASYPTSIIITGHHKSNFTNASQPNDFRTSHHLPCLNTLRNRRRNRPHHRNSRQLSRRCDRKSNRHPLNHDARPYGRNRNAQDLYLCCCADSLDDSHSRSQC